MPKSVLRAVLERMQFTLRRTRRTPPGASRLVQAMSAWLVKTRHDSSRHSRDARVYTLWSYDYGHAQTEYTRAPPTSVPRHATMTTTKKRQTSCVCRPSVSELCCGRPWSQRRHNHQNNHNKSPPPPAPRHQQQKRRATAT